MPLKPGTIQESVKQLLETTKGRPEEFAKTAGQIAEQLANVEDRGQIHQKLA